jgi:hypothetical protein
VSVWSSLLVEARKVALGGSSGGAAGEEGGDVSSASVGVLNLCLRLAINDMCVCLECDAKWEFHTEQHGGNERQACVFLSKSEPVRRTWTGAGDKSPCFAYTARAGTTDPQSHVPASCGGVDQVTKEWKIDKHTLLEVKA